MKTIITVTFLLFSFLGFSQTTREEVVKRTDDGQKLIVNTYSGIGNSEKLVKRTTYEYSTTYKSISSKPVRFDYFGNYKIVFSSGSVSMFWGAIKIERYNNQGVLESTWKITDDNSSYVTYTIIP